MAVIEVEALTKRYGDLVAVDDLTFTVESGRIVGFLGRNGAGKTTTLRILLGLVEPTSGSAEIHGRPFARLSDPVRTVGAVLENSGWHPGRTGLAQVRVWCRAGRLPAGRADEVLQLVGLRDVRGRRIGQYSQGMRQRLSLAIALIGDPSLLILDEPANGLDPEGVRWLRDFLRALAAEGRTVLLSSHQLAEVTQGVDEVMIVEDGRLMAKRPLDALLSEVAEVVRVRSPEATRLIQVLNLDRDRARRAEDGWIEVRGMPKEGVGEVAAALDIPIYALESAHDGLESVFLDVVKDAARGEAQG